MCLILFSDKQKSLEEQMTLFYVYKQTIKIKATAHINRLWNVDWNYNELNV